MTSVVGSHRNEQRLYPGTDQKLNHAKRKPGLTLEASLPQGAQEYLSLKGDKEKIAVWEGLTYVQVPQILNLC